MFARSCPRMGVRFASGNVFYMNQTFSARHLQCVSSPLSTGFVTPLRFTSTTGVSRSGLGSAVALPTDAVVEASLLDQVLNGCTGVAEGGFVDVTCFMPSTVLPIVCEHVKGVSCTGSERAASI